MTTLALPGQSYFHTDIFSTSIACSFPEVNKTNTSLFTKSLSYARDWKEILIGNLAEVYEECSGRGWDGYDAEPISYKSVKNVAALILSIPEEAAPPEVGPEADGSIALEWLEENKVFSLSLINNVIYYAYISGNKKHHGQTPFIDELPKEVTDFICKDFLQT